MMGRLRQEYAASERNEAAQEQARLNPDTTLARDR
jgi:hypothetical protein